MTQNSVPYLIQLKDQNGFPINIVGEESPRICIPINTSNIIIPQFEPSTPNTINIKSQNINLIKGANVEVLQGVEGVRDVMYQIIYPEDLELKPVFNNAKRGRPKKKKIVEPPIEPDVENPPKTARTRSGRVIKIPKRIEQDFKKIVISDEPEVQTTTFEPPPTEQEAKTDTVLEILENHQRKRTISAQFRCPKCGKAYLGKNKMIQHIKKYPDHGPLPENWNDLNFEVWNYLVDITQKCAPGTRGTKFCEELTNLLHNVQLLTSAIFKEAEDKSTVEIDKVLGNAIGLTPGKYKFDENELHKDVTIHKLITNTDFFKPKNNFTKPNSNVNMESAKITEEQSYFTKNVSTASNDFNSDPVENNLSKENALEPQTESIYNFKKDIDLTETKKLNPLENDLHPELLSDNSLMNSLPNLRTVDDLMLGHVDGTASLLDNSTSSDEVMNVDQFVNERFKKITEPDELNTNSLNLDLPSLDLFQFHTT